MDWQKIKQLNEERGAALNEMKGLLKKAEDEKRDLTAEENTAFDVLNAKAEQRKLDIDRYETAKRLDAELAAKGEQRQQPGRDDINTPESQADEQAKEHRSQFVKFLRGGNPLELRALTVSGQGVVGTREFSNELLKSMKSYAGVLEAGATLIPTTDGNPMTIPSIDDTANSGRLAGEAVTNNNVTEFVTSGEQGLVGKLVGGSEAVVGGIAYAADYLSLAKAGFKSLQAGATFAVFGIVKAVDLVGGGLTSLLNLLPGVSVQWTNFTGQLADGLLDEAKQLQDEAGQAFGSFMDGDASKAVGRAFDGIRAGSAAAAAQAVADAPKIGGALDDVAERAEQLQKVSDALKGLQGDVSTTGLGDTDEEIAKLKELGATDAQLQQSRGLLTIKGQLDGLGAADSGDPLTYHRPALLAAPTFSATYSAGSMSRSICTGRSATPKRRNRGTD